MKLNGLITYTDTYSHVLNCFGRPDSITSINVDKTDSTNNTWRVYFKNSSFIKYGDSVNLERIDLATLPGIFVTCGKFRLNRTSTIDSLKFFHPAEMNSELTADEQTRYTLWGIADKTDLDYSFWMLYFDKSTRRLLFMKHISFS
ncbi:hypothetical protein HQ865_23990 [Mucilaginibacter mali]|uniref:Uncharacterized protein n=1 Tax=Mucilaginibacter mali TaxID=2740462 RepID=A0A7D4QNQ8_9SPHI|nr:hypothetical protein [Mucilaginibacter mali]QKJ32690.1 hypothetical protein HQ865_23990 [Mucilaginibacter mali]